MAGAERMQTFNEWKISECGQFFHGCIVPVEKSKALEQVYEEPSLYDKLFGGPEAMQAVGEINKYHEEDDNSLNFETFKIFMGGDGSAPPAPGQRKKKRQSREEKD